jgi:dTDP-4-amino-4,6-dideoxygalactose transaminase
MRTATRTGVLANGAVHGMATSEVAPELPLVDPWLPASYADAVREQVLSGRIGCGDAVQEFSSALSRFVGARGAIATVSGTVALSVAARVIGLRPGDEVLVPAYGVVSTINAFASIGMKPRLVDIDRRTACISSETLKAALTPSTRAACFVNFSGYTGANVAEVAEVCQENDIPLIEDAACALGHRFNGISAGMFGDVGTYSFSVPKVITMGQGGALVARDPEILERAAAFIDQGDLEWRRTNSVRGVGTNLRPTDMQAALGLHQLRDADTRLARRRASYAVLRERLGDRLYAVPGTEAPLHNIVFASRADDLVASLKRLSISATRAYRTVSQHPIYGHLAGHASPNADYWTDHAVYLPFGVGLRPHDAERIADAVKASGVPLDTVTC